ncbi:MAG: hypothetical protein OXE94_02810 [Aestuariivita sp.]|nr:hypothetical protein [Aestuariivita sp.]MCY4203654.1 hypothetical protein [Aestuariivita sp.]
MARLKLPINDRKTPCLHGPEEPFEFLGIVLDAMIAIQARGLILARVRASRAFRASAAKLVSKRQQSME